MRSNTSSTALPEAADAEGSGPSSRPGAAAPALLNGIERSLASLRAEPLDAGVGDGELVASVERLARLERMVAAEQMRRIAAVDARGAHTAAGAGSTATMLAARLGLTRAEARTRTETANALEELPGTADRLAAGQLGVSHAEVAARKLRDVTSLDDGKTPDQRDEVRSALDGVVAAVGRQGDRKHLRDQLDVWADRQGHDSLAGAEQRAWRRRRAWLATPTSPERMSRLTADLPPVQAAKLRAALGPLLRKDTAEDPRSIEQRCADGLTSLAERALDAGELPETAAQRPHVLLIATADGLAGRPGADPSLLDGHGPVSSETARQLACDSDVTRVTVGRNGDVLDVGRSRRDPTRAQRAAVIARDRSCRGCGAPASRSEVHHVHWWSLDGPTDLDNLVLVCWDCHAHIHHHNWQVIRQAPGNYLVRPPGQGPARAGPPGTVPPPDRPPSPDRLPVDGRRAPEKGRQLV